MNCLIAEDLMDWAQDEQMPTYRFKCDVCGAVFETRLHMTDDKSTVVCPLGHTKVHQIHFIPQIIFKGSGFYSTDRRSDSRVRAIDVNR